MKKKGDIKQINLELPTAESQEAHSEYIDALEVCIDEIKLRILGILPNILSNHFGSEIQPNLWPLSKVSVPIQYTMAVVTMVMPTMGESVMEATILQWLKQEGDMITEEESILEVATDKVNFEVPALYAGRLQKVLVQKGEVVKIGAPLAIIATEGETIADSSTSLASAVTLLPSAAVCPLQPMLALQGPIHKQSDGRFYSPLVHHIAQQEKISPQVRSRVPGTGKNNCMTKHDLLAYLQHCSEVDNPLLPAVAYMPIVPEDEVIQLDRMRQLIAERMVASKHIAPHVTSFVEADVTDLVQWRNQHKEDFEQKNGAKLTYTLLFLQAIV